MWCVGSCSGSLSGGLRARVGSTRFGRKMAAVEVAPVGSGMCVVQAFQRVGE